MGGGIELTPSGPFDNVVAPMACGLYFASTAAWGATTGYGCRVRVPKSGTMTDLAIYVGSTSAGNVDVAVYDTSATRVRLYTTGTIACPAATGWRIVGALSLAVSRGDQFDFALSTDSATATFGRSLFNQGAQGQLPAGYIAGSGASPWLNWYIGSATLGATIAEGALSNTTIIPAIIARIA